jgi:hypothetical protein
MTLALPHESRGPTAHPDVWRIRAMRVLQNNLRIESLRKDYLLVARIVKPLLPVIQRLLRRVSEAAFVRRRLFDHRMTTKGMNIGEFWRTLAETPPAGNPYDNAISAYFRNSARWP